MEGTVVCVQTTGLGTKISFGRRIWRWVVNEHMKDHKAATGLTRAEAEAIATCVCAYRNMCVAARLLACEQRQGKH